MSKNTQKPQQKLSSLERIERLEAFAGGMSQNFQSIVMGVNQSLGELNSGVNNIGETVDGILAVLAENDPEFGQKVLAKMQAARDARIQAASDKEKADLEAMVEAGLVAKTEEVKETSYVVGIERLEDGSVLFPGRIAGVVHKFNPEVAEKLIGTTVGDTVPVPGNRTLEVTEIYDFVEASDETPADIAAPAEA